MKNFLNFLKSKVFFIQIGIAFVVLLVFVFVVLRWLNSSTNHGDFVVVPDLAKLTVTEMRDVVDEASLRFEVLDSANYNPDYPRFSVIEQNPPAGNKVKENRKVYVTVNPSGYKKVSVPKIIQVTRRNATAKLRAIGLDVQRVTYIDEFGKDMVYRIKYKGKYIEEGYKLPKTSKIELICGNGNESESNQVKSESEEQ